MSETAVVKTLDYLGNKSRLIVAGMYLDDGSIAFIDRKNSSLLITNTDQQSKRDLDLTGILPSGYRDMKGKEEVKPSDVNSGFEKGQPLITYTGKDFSLAISCRLERQGDHYVLSEAHQVIRIPDRSRSVIVIDNDHVCATTQWNVVIKRKDDDTDAYVASNPRDQRDSGGLLMTDGKGRFYYGDGHCFVCCYLNGSDILEKFRFSDCNMKFPRGSAIANSGEIFVCCDESYNIYRISKDGKQSQIVLTAPGKQFGDIDFHPNGKQFFTSFWKENEWPVINELKD